jgi:hypothetical protein
MELRTLEIGTAMPAKRNLSAYRTQINLVEAIKEKLAPAILEHGSMARVIRGALWMWMMAGEEAGRIAVKQGGESDERFSDPSDPSQIAAAAISFHRAVEQVGEAQQRSQSAKPGSKRGTR